MGYLSQPTMVFVAGMILGGLTAFCIGSIIGFVRNRAVRQRNDKRDQIITSVGEAFAEVDSIIAIYRTGRMKIDALQTSLAEKFETVNHIYKPHIHQLDIFYVKYIEKVIQEYNRLFESADDGVSPAEQSSPEPQSIRVPEPPAAAPLVEATAAPLVAQPEESTTELSLEPPVAAIAEQDDSPVDQIAAIEAPALEPEIEAQGVEEEPLISAMTEAAQEEDELPLETFLEMETGTGMIDEPIEEKQLPGLETQVQAAETKAMFDKLREEMRADELLPPPPSPLEAAAIPEPPEPFSFASRTERDVVQPKISFPLPPQAAPAEQPRQRPPSPSFSSDEVVQPATIYDVEAETIIADRNSILGIPAPAETERSAEKKNLGITGEDVMETFDKFFGI